MTAVVPVVVPSTCRAGHYHYPLTTKTTRRVEMSLADAQVQCARYVSLPRRTILDTLCYCNQQEGVEKKLWVREFRE